LIATSIIAMSAGHSHAFALPANPALNEVQTASSGSPTNIEVTNSNQETAKSNNESLFSKDYFKLLFDDTTYVLTSPARWEKKDWTIFSLAALGVAAVALLDKPVWDFMRRNQTDALDRIADLGSDITGIESVALLAPFYIVGEVSKNTKAIHTALDGWAVSLIGGGIISPALKFIAGRRAPRDNEGTYTFNPFSYGFQMSGGAQSFPSGHAIQSFGIASVIASHYEEPWVKVTAYTIAALGSSARLYQGVHFISDFTAGAIIGTVVGRTVVHFNEKRRKEKREETVFLTPFVRPGFIALGVTLRLE
jgi:membrane-associated phospholipid phosphatase